MKLNLALAATVALFVLPTAAQAVSPTQAFQNGGFENGTFSQSASSQVLTAGSNAITGWTVIGSNVEWDKNGNVYGITSSEGSYSLDLSGNPDNIGSGVQQSFSTIANHDYSLSFDVGTNGSYTPPSGASIQVLINGVAAFTGSNTTVVQGQNWNTVTGTFTATGSSTTLGLTGLSGLNYIGLDNVKVADLTPNAPGVPEAATWAMMILGMGAVGAVMRRKVRASEIKFDAKIKRIAAGEIA